METRFYRRFRLWRLPFLISKKIKIRERRETRLLRYTDSEWQGCLNIWTVFCLNCGGTTKNRSGDLGFNNFPQTATTKPLHLPETAYLQALEGFVADHGKATIHCPTKKVLSLEV